MARSGNERLEENAPAGELGGSLCTAGSIDLASAQLRTTKVVMKIPVVSIAPGTDGIDVTELLLIAALPTFSGAASRTRTQWLSSSLLVHLVATAMVPCPFFDEFRIRKQIRHRPRDRCGSGSTGTGKTQQRRMHVEGGKRPGAVRPTVVRRKGLSCSEVVVESISKGCSNHFSALPGCPSPGPCR